jgi:hypothetical protein
LKQQCDGAGETSRTTNYELQGTGRATRAPVAQIVRLLVTVEWLSILLKSLVQKS